MYKSTHSHHFCKCFFQPESFPSDVQQNVARTKKKVYTRKPRDFHTLLNDVVSRFEANWNAFAVVCCCIACCVLNHERCESSIDPSRSMWKQYLDVNSLFTRILECKMVLCKWWYMEFLLKSCRKRWRTKSRAM